QRRRMAAEADTIRVLVVDDHAVVRRGLLAFLEGESDFAVVGDAEGGVEAVDLLARLDAQGMRPHVVLMDLQMRPVDGIESTRMRSRPQYVLRTAGSFNSMPRSLARSCPRFKVELWFTARLSSLLVSSMSSRLSARAGRTKKLRGSLGSASEQRGRTSRTFSANSGSPRELSLRSGRSAKGSSRSEEHTSELQSRGHLVCRLLLE